MSTDNAATSRRLAAAFDALHLHRPRRVARYDAGDELTYRMTGVVPAVGGTVRATVEKFVGGGFAGQVYRVRVTSVEPDPGSPGPAGIVVGRRYAMKILVPPSRFARRFRDALYAVGFQAPFQHQVNPAAARAGALWQKFIRRAAGIRFGTQQTVKDVLATFVDERIGSCGELSEWVEGRTWRFEVDDRLDARRRWLGGHDVPADQLGSPEYRHKRVFMRQFVRLLHELGAREFARQYEWWTCKSQPNVFKRTDTDDDVLTAMDFRAGLVLLCVLPMSPADVKLILTGLARGALVQFDRGSVERLERYVDAHAEHFTDMRAALDELKQADRAYRDSQIDVTHNHVRLLTRPGLWGRILDAAVTGWRIEGMADERCAARLGRSRTLTLLFALVGLIPPASLMGGVALLLGALLSGWTWYTAVATAVAVVIAGRAAGKATRKLWGRGDLRRHYLHVLTRPVYLSRAARGHLIEKLIAWQREQRITANRAERLAERPVRAFGHALLSPLPAALHRMLMDAAFAREKLAYVFVRPIRLYFNAAAREQWLRDMLDDGRRHGMLSDDDADQIEARIKEPFIQKYLKSLAVHICTLPISQVVALAVAGVYIYYHPELTFKEAIAVAGGALVAVQIVPISPGSFVRGIYVVYLVARERNVRDYNIAIWLSFFKYIGYLAFPIQMAYRYPALARFMAAHWATGAVHAVPVFGERGALLEHAVFDAFYNRPLTIRRKMRLRAARRAALPRRTWHAPGIAAAAVAAWAGINAVCLRWYGAPPTLSDIWWLVPLLGMGVGAGVAAGAGGSPLARRIRLAVLTGAVTGVGYGLVHVLWPWTGTAVAWNWPLVRDLVSAVAWRAFFLAILATLGALAWETLAPEEE
ncbi:MAG: hypothetical protein ACOC8F_06990 [Planctomycetota bacterium]